jgi:large subunit ribosomal protein L30
MPGKLRVRLRKSPISYTAKARGTVRALGLHRLHETVEVTDNPATRGMVRAVRFLVDFEVVPEAQPAPAARRRGAAAAPAAAPTSAPAEAAAETGQGDATPAETNEGPAPEEERA